MLRQDYNQIMAAYKKVAKGNARLTQSDLILMREIDPNTTNYRFPVLENEAAIVFPEEVRLNINDQFAITHVGIFIGASVGSTKGSEPMQLFTYAPDELGLPILTLKGLYSGYMKIDVNNVNFVDKWNVRKHEMIPTKQFSNYDPAIFNPPFQPSIDYKSDGIFPMCPNIILSGAKKNDVQLFLPRAIAQAIGTWTIDGAVPPTTIQHNFQYIVIVLRGFLAQNAAKFQG